MLRPKTHGVAIRVFLADGTPQGLRIVERLGWTGACLAFARADYQSVRARDEVGRTGVYILTGPETDGKRLVRAYVGEGDSVRTRIDQHFREKEFWTEAFIFTTTDNSLNKAQGRYLEAWLLQLAKEADVATLDNGTAPERPWLSEPDIAVMDSYLDYGLALLPLLGVNLFEVVDERPVADQVTATAEATAPAGRGEPEDRPLLYLNTVLTVAQGRDEARGFVVYEGATARRLHNVMQPGYEQLRERLIKEGALQVLDDQRYVLTRNTIFDSPSAAASVLAGGAKNGRSEWKTHDGVTLKELQDQVVSAESEAADSVESSMEIFSIGLNGIATIEEGK